jgi:hypothetical protein
MLKSEYDSVIVGKNYLSFILSLFQLKDNKSVLLVDDERVIYGENWHKNIGEIEKNFLQLIGIEYNIKPLKEINEYLEVSPYYLCLNHKLIKLGHSAFENIKELMRKFPECFSSKRHKIFEKDNEKDFNRSAEVFFYNLAENAFRLRKTQSFDESVLDKSMDNLFKNLFSDFLTNYTTKPEAKETFRQLLFCLQGKFQSLFTDSYSNTEMKFLLAQAISPRYQLNEAKLNQDLEQCLIESKGVKKNTTIQYWQFYQKKLTSILLSSYEGVIHPNTTHFIGNFHSGMPFITQKDYRVFTDLILDVEYPQEVFNGYVGKKIMFNSFDRLGSDYPLWEAQIINKQKARVRYLYPMESGSKPEFFKEQAQKDIFFSFTKMFPRFKGQMAQDTTKVSQGFDLWSEAFSYSGGKRNKKNFESLFQNKGLKILDNEGKDEVKAFEYWGPMQMHPLGLFSFLMDMKNHY